MRLLGYIIMRNIRTRRIKTEGGHFFAGPFQDSVLEIQLDKHRQCLTAIQKNQYERAAELLHQITHDEALISLQKKEQNMIEFLTLNVKAYLALRGGKHEEGMKCLEGLKGGKNKEDGVGSMRSALTVLIKSCFLCHQGKLEQSKQTINIAFETIKNNKNREQFSNGSRNIQKYNEIFIIFFDMIAIQLSKMTKFSDILSIYKQSYQLSTQILGKDHKLTCRMKSIIQQNSNDGVLSSKTQSSKGNRGPFTRNLRSKRKLKINQQKMPLITKQQQMKRIYTQNDDILLVKPGDNQNKLTRRDQTYYLKSLERVNSIYNSRNQCRNQQFSENIADFSRDTTFYGKMNTQSGYEYSRRRIKDIILKGRRLNKEMIYIRDAQVESFMETTTQNPPLIEEPIQVHIEPVEKEKEKEKKKEEERNEDKVKVTEQEKKPELTFQRIVEKVEEARETRKEECQLI